MIEVAIIIVNYNGWKDTIKCIESVLLSNHNKFRIIVTDNNSLDNSIGEFTSWGKKNGYLIETADYFSWSNNNLDLDNQWKVTFIKNPDNSGFAGGNNLGIKFIQNRGLEIDYFWLLNNDTIVEQETLEYLVNRMESEKLAGSQTGILGCKIMFYDETDQIQGIGGKYNKYLAVSSHIGRFEKDIGQYDISEVEMDYVIGASMFVSQEFMNSVGLLREDYFLYFEELDWVKRSQKLNWQIGYEFKAKIYHKEGGTTMDRNIISRFADKCQVSNRLVFTYRFHPYCLFTVVPVIFGSVVNRIWRGQFYRALYILLVIFKTLGIIFLGRYEK